MCKICVCVLHVGIRLFQHHLLKRLSFLHLSSLLCQKSVDYIYVGVFWALFCSTDSFICSFTNASLKKYIPFVLQYVQQGKKLISCTTITLFSPLTSPCRKHTDPLHPSWELFTDACPILASPSEKTHPYSGRESRTCQEKSAQRLYWLLVPGNFSPHHLLRISILKTNSSSSDT